MGSVLTIHCNRRVLSSNPSLRNFPDLVRSLSFPIHFLSTLNYPITIGKNAKNKTSLTSWPWHIFLPLFFLCPGQNVTTAKPGAHFPFSNTQKCKHVHHKWCVFESHLTADLNNSLDRKWVSRHWPRCAEAQCLSNKYDSKIRIHTKCWARKLKWAIWSFNQKNCGDL